MKVMQHLGDHFISLPNIVGYLVAAAVAWWLGNWFVNRHQTKLHWQLRQHSLDEPTSENIAEEQEIIRKSLASQLAAKIGRLEKLVYILAVMLEQYGLVTAVVILKAFFGWITIPLDSSEIREVKDRLQYY